MQNSIKTRTSKDESGGMFVSADELNNMNFLSGKQLESGNEEFSNSKPWTKSMKDIEAEQKNNREIITEIKKLEEKVDKALIKLEQIDKALIKFEQIEINTMSNSNTNWKDKLKIW